MSACQHPQAMPDPVLRILPCVCAVACSSELQHATCPSSSARQSLLAT
ncbi:hypothetical protein TIFTF001_015243 [Ficus carica]|uniref:Uncharacterized protein n=1 Tax=Ficus carica TaxID=3494 RepID=A0AA88AL79_FICCA|nr:hypothetical protein TIFTF001_015243 [Ficus carica]